jgi:hypothetical protein
LYVLAADRDVPLQRRAQIVVLLQHRPQDLVALGHDHALDRVVRRVHRIGGAQLVFELLHQLPSLAERAALAIGYARELAIIAATLRTRDRSG